MAGWDSEVTFGSATNYFFWIPWILPHIGGVFGAVVYFVAVSMHHAL